MKYAKEFEKLFNNNKFPVFTIGDIMLAFEGSGMSYEYLRLMLHKYARSGRIKRISKGVYTFHNDTIVVGFAFKPFYYGLESALSLLGFSTQGANNAVMTIRSVRTGVRSFEGRNYRVMRIKSKYFFGYKLLQYDSFWVPVSDLEKTFIDMEYFKIGIRKELVREAISKLDMNRLNKYLKAYNVSFGRKVAGYFADILQQ
ncbi:MAG: type IV toxin-antitoxin system AbiEi family antitoxin domain-containing protein [Candidatus Marsarchaeota archaeon]|jgi:predicted transcriptional regulator of viral defense system|nr:type IV toxin-antitoxin system AbiEi family antitoxin domain-containing protein [Candidatus Marsarchaeota archaeon]MCL5419191.1 type IV toxin-antitoxin system AbiEi family antitoxin domain-containing protein [Candidatus Marsarchaeota archaeon]